MRDRALNSFRIFHIYYNETSDMMTIKFSNGSKELSIYIGGSVAYIIFRKEGMGWVEPNSEELIPLKADINCAIILKKKKCTCYLNKCYRLRFWEWSNLWAPCCLAFSTNLSFLNKKEKRVEILLVDVDPPTQKQNNNNGDKNKKYKTKQKKQGTKRMDESTPRGIVERSWNSFYITFWHHLKICCRDFGAQPHNWKSTSLESLGFYFKKKKKGRPLRNMIMTGWSVILRRDDWFRVLSRNINLRTGWGGSWFLLI